MLEHLAAYAQRRGILARPGFSAKHVRWAIRCHSSRGYLGVVELGDTTDRRNPGRLFPCCPDLSPAELIAGGVRRSHFLVETAAVAVGLGVAEDDSKTREKHDFFVELLRRAGPRAAPPGPPGGDPGGARHPGAHPARSGGAAGQTQRKGHLRAGRPFPIG